MKHTIHSDLLDNKVYVTLVGVGGSGSQMLTGLARLHVALRACGHPQGLTVTAYDPDLVSAANVGRQLFSPADIGSPKACVLVHRLNCYFGLDWQAHPARYIGIDPGRPPIPQDLVISCVDSAMARRDLHHGMTGKYAQTPKYWLDLGNAQLSGQVILGQPDRGTISHYNESKLVKKEKHTGRLPTIVELYPEMLLDTFGEDTAPSCSLAESLEKQDLFINDHVSRWALHLLWTLFRRGAIEHHGYFINLESGVVNPLSVPSGKETKKKEAKKHGA